ncbi:MAG: ATP-binding protein [Vicinamibacterales bacterium]|nr:ATP-binding protein [Vicinamibacterales bacterium]
MREEFVAPCECAKVHTPRRIVLTGGPGAGKTAVLELIRQSFCPHVKVLPEAAGIVFGGGFPREEGAECRRAAQRAIFHVQRELEVMGDQHNAAIVLCDRGTIDGLAYWPGPEEQFWSSLLASCEQELGRYDTVVHLRTPRADNGYNNQNPLRSESAAAAALIDERLLHIWERHPRRFVVESSRTFLEKARRVLDILREEVPGCCRQHAVFSVRADDGAGDDSR